jgi:hypothetical protein
LIGHQGFTALYALVRAQYYGIPKRTAEQVVKGCLACASYEPLKARDDMEHVVASYPLERIQMDLIDLSRYNSVNYIIYDFLNSILLG